MQLHALNKDNRIVHVKNANKHETFKCIECGDFVKLRGGIYRQLHFYHVNTNRHCRQNGKSLEHIQVQNYIHSLFSDEECALEFKFSQINRIADVALINEKIIFEIQCSPIDSQEIQQRNINYKSLGWDVVWILHDQTFNKFRMTPAEILLLNQNHYFTNINQQGEGIIYDQFDVPLIYLRTQKKSSLPIQVNKFIRKEQLKSVNKFFLMNTVNNRINNWSFSFTGDLIDINLTGNYPEYIKEAKDVEKKTSNSEPTSYSKKSKIWEKVNQYFMFPISLIFKIILEKACK